MLAAEPTETFDLRIIALSGLDSCLVFPLLTPQHRSLRSPLPNPTSLSPPAVRPRDLQAPTPGLPPRRRRLGRRLRRALRPPSRRPLPLPLPYGPGAPRAVRLPDHPRPYARRRTRHLGRRATGADGGPDSLAKVPVPDQPTGPDRARPRLPGRPDQSDRAPGIKVPGAGGRRAAESGPAGQFRVPDAGVEPPGDGRVPPRGALLG